MSLGWIIGGLLAGVVLICWLQYRAQAGTYRPLSSRQPERTAIEDRPLGTEALDLDAVRRTQRQNESLERAHTNWTRGRSGILGAAAADTHIAPLADDETYAKRFHAAYMNKKDMPK